MRGDSTTPMPGVGRREIRSIARKTGGAGHDWGRKWVVICGAKTPRKGDAMRGRPRKPYHELQNKRGDRRRVVLDLGGGVTWTVPADSLAAALALRSRPQQAGAGDTLSPKAAIARQKPRDGRGRFVKIATTADAATEPRSAG